MEHHRNASACGTWINVQNGVSQIMPLNVSLQNQLATKMAHNTQNDGKNFSGGSRWNTQNIASILTCFVSWGFFWLEQTWNRGMYKQIQNCDQFASSKQYVVVMHYLKKNICMEKKSDRFHRRDKIGFLNSVKIGTEELWQQTKDIFLNENPIFLHTRFFSDPLLLHFL